MDVVSCAERASNWPAPSDEHLTGSGSDGSTRLRSGWLAQQFANAEAQGAAGTHSSQHKEWIVVRGESRDFPLQLEASTVNAIVAPHGS